MKIQRQLYIKVEQVKRFYTKQKEELETTEIITFSCRRYISRKVLLSDGLTKSTVIIAFVRSPAFHIFLQF